MRVFYRLLKFALPTLLLVGFSVWLADRPGSVTIHWQGWRIDTTVPVVVFGLVALLVVVWWLDRLGRAALALPRRWLDRRRLIKQRQGYLALTQGMAAMTSGDSETARKLAQKAKQLLHDPELTDLLSAEAARLDGDAKTAEQHFQSLAEHSKMPLSGLRGLMSLAQDKGDEKVALSYAKRAWPLAKGAAAGEIAEQILTLYARASAWSDADLFIEQAKSRKALAKDRAAHWQAIIQTERAAEAQGIGDDASALRLLKSAHKAQPDFIPAALGAARLLSKRHDTRAASGILADCWKRTPHPELAHGWRQLWADLDPLVAFRNFAKALESAPPSEAGHLALADAAIDAKLWGQARHHLEAILTDGPAYHAYKILAKLERAEHRDEAKARHWLDLAEVSPQPHYWECSNCRQAVNAYAALCPHCHSSATIDPIV